MHRDRAAVAAGVAAVVVAGSLVPAPENGGGLPPGADKLLHVAGYAAVAWAWGRALDPPTDRGLAAVAVGAALLGAGVEVVQPTVGRTASGLDAAANLAGAVVGALAVWVSRSR
jgi:VanZ family protein